MSDGMGRVRLNARCILELWSNWGLMLAWYGDESGMDDAGARVWEMVCVGVGWKAGFVLWLGFLDCIAPGCYHAYFFHLQTSDQFYISTAIFSICWSFFSRFWSLFCFWRIVSVVLVMIEFFLISCHGTKSPVVLQDGLILPWWGASR